MSLSTIWWLLAGSMVGIELVTGTFYLLMLAVGLVAAAISAHLGVAPAIQITTAAVVGAGAVLVLRRYRQTRPKAAPASANRDVNLDIGGTVMVDGWRPDGTSTVKYRGASWTVSAVPGDPLLTGPHQVVEVVGSCLVVRKL